MLPLQLFVCCNSSEFIEYVGENTLIKEIYKDIVDNFIIYKMDKGNINSITMNSYLRSIRAFLYFLY